MVAGAHRPRQRRGGRRRDSGPCSNNSSLSYNKHIWGEERRLIHHQTCPNTEHNIHTNQTLPSRPASSPSSTAIFSGRTPSSTCTSTACTGTTRWEWERRGKGEREGEPPLFVCCVCFLFWCVASSYMYLLPLHQFFTSHLYNFILLLCPLLSPHIPIGGRARLHQPAHLRTRSGPGAPNRHAGGGVYREVGGGRADDGGEGKGEI